MYVPPTKTKISRPRESVTLEIPRLWPTIMADYYDKPKKTMGYTQALGCANRRRRFWTRPTNYPREADRPTLGIIKTSL